MAEPTPVNGQITDAVTQTNVKVLAEAPAMAMGTIYQSMAHSTGLMFENAVNAQQQLNTLAQAATTLGATTLSQSDVPDNLMDLLAALRAGTAPLPT
jgi:hypothetical protein